ncbi:MAG: ABC transporter permease [Phycisphaeraceae bacterium]|nr:ABC transporter permease [Phycisphaeraceae bacterium]MCW5754159.1 ABC transporter permease [Phycisphaeraceae bacterium]
MVIRLFSIARNAFVESLRQPIYLFILIACGIMQVLNTWVTGFSMQDRLSAGLTGDDRLLLDIGLATIFGCGTLLAGFVATATISREIENKTILTVVSKPIGRTTVIVGKYLGVTLAIALAVATMLIFLLLAVRHGVLSTAADKIDGPVVTFSILALFVAVFIGVWTNFFYGWSFPQTVSVALFPAFFVAYLLVLSLSKRWTWQELGHDFRPQIALACGVLSLALLVLTSIAVAASTRLGQVMTIMLCAGIFVFGLLSNHLLGQRAFENRAVASIRTAVAEDPTDPSFTKPGQIYTITLDGPPEEEFRPGDSFYYGSSANGFRLAVAAFPPFEGDPRAEGLLRDGIEPRIIVTDVDGERLTIRHIGATPLRVTRPPETGDIIFKTPTQRNVPRIVAWALVPNMNAYWLMDAIAQNRKIPPRHVGLVALYSLCLIVASLSLAVALFQGRDVG